MSMTHGDVNDFLVLRHPDQSPAVIRVSRIKDIQPMDLHQCKIIYDNDTEMIIEGDYTELKIKIADKLAKKEEKRGRKRKG